MYRKSLFISEPFVVQPHSDNLVKMTYVLDNTEVNTIEYFKSVLQNNNCEYRMYWESKFDRNVIEVNPPTIYDAYNCIVLAIGDIEDIYDSIGKLQIRNDRVEFLEKCLGDIDLPPLEKPIDISAIATAILNDLF